MQVIHVQLQAEIDERFRNRKATSRKVRTKRKSREGAREDKILAKRIMIEGGDIKRNERQEADLQKFQEGRPEITM